MKRGVKALALLTFLAFAALAAGDSSSGSGRAELYLGTRLVLATDDFINQEGTIFLPLEESARALDLECFYNRANGTIFLRRRSTLVMINSGRKEITVGNEVSGLARAPAWTDTKVYLPAEVFTGALAGVMGEQFRVTGPGSAAPAPGTAAPPLEPPASRPADPGAIPTHPPEPAPGPAPAAPPGQETQPSALRNPVDVIVIDPGHGGHDPGARGPNDTLEKDVTLQIAKKLRTRLLADPRLRVHLTRDQDVFLPLPDRPGRAAQLGADVFVSIHANGYKLMSAQGFETFFASLTATDQAAMDLALYENQAGAGEQAPPREVINDLELILGDMAQAESLTDSQRLAEMIQVQMARVMNSDNRGVKQAPFRVLMDAAMPAVLVEVGFITSPAEARTITDPETQARIVEALAKAILGYRDQANARLGLAPTR